MINTIFKILLTHLTIVKFEFKTIPLGKVIDDDMSGRMKVPINTIFNRVDYGGEVLTQTYDGLFRPVYDNIFLSLLNSGGFVEYKLNGKVVFNKFNSHIIDGFAVCRYCELIAEGFKIK